MFTKEERYKLYFLSSYLVRKVINKNIKNILREMEVLKKISPYLYIVYSVTRKHTYQEKIKLQSRKLSRMGTRKIHAN